MIALRLEVKNVTMTIKEAVKLASLGLATT